MRNKKRFYVLDTSLKYTNEESVLRNRIEDIKDDIRMLQLEINIFENDYPTELLTAIQNKLSDISNDINKLERGFIYVKRS